MIEATLLIGAGLVAGAIASALGVGGGVVFVPVLAVGLALDQATAQGTSLAVIVPTVLIGTYVHARRGRVVWAAALPVAAGGIVGGLLGARIALATDPQLLRRLFAALLVLLAARLIVGELRADRPISDR